MSRAHDLEPMTSSPRRARVLGVLLMIGVFAAGAVFGAGLIHQHQPGPPPPPPSPADRLIHQLHLTPAQAKRLHELNEAHREELGRLMRETMPRIRAVLDSVENELRPDLTDEQRALLDEVQASRPPADAPLPGMPGGPPPGGPPPGGRPGGPPPGDHPGRPPGPPPF